MNIRNYFIIAVGGALVGAASGFAWRAFDSAPESTVPAPVATVKQIDVIPSFSYLDTEGRQRHSHEFANKVMVLNFWATWCKPCHEETPEFVALQEDFGDRVQFIGIAIDDLDPVREFGDTYSVNYPLLLGDMEAIAMSRQLGNRYEGLPFTVVATPGGKVVMRHTGGIEREQLEPLLKELTEAS